MYEKMWLLLLSRTYNYVFLKTISKLIDQEKREVNTTMFFLLPGGQIMALYYLLIAMLQFHVWPSIVPNGHTLLGFTTQQAGLVCLVVAF
jgi:hypothetical protein